MVKRSVPCGRSAERTTSCRPAAGPVLLGEHAVRVAQRDQARVERAQRLRRDAGRAETLRRDRLHGRERVLDAVLEFLDEEVALLLGDPALGRVAEHDTQAVAEREQLECHPAALDDDRFGFGPDGFAALHDLEEEPAETGFARARERVPNDAAEHVFRFAAEMSRRIAVEQDDAPVASDRVKPLADAVENGRKAGFGEKRRDFFGNGGGRNFGHWQAG